MSADNGIYIAKFLDGYKVIEAQSIDNLTFYPEGSKENINTWKEYFEDQAVTFKTLDEAIKYAVEMEDEMMKMGCFLEYGIVNLGEGVEWDPLRAAIKIGTNLK